MVEAPPGTVVAMATRTQRLKAEAAAAASGTPAAKKKEKPPRKTSRGK